MHDCEAKNIFAFLVGNKTNHASVLWTFEFLLLLFS